MEQILIVKEYVDAVNWLDVLFWTLIVAGGIQVIYYLFVYLRIAFHKPIRSYNIDKPVSVVIAARNEINNLQANLPEILAQKHPNFEVVVVNDSSFDGTKAYLDELASREPRLKPVHLDIDERYQKGKKFALTIGIKAAQYETLLLTDADCKPASDQWISAMSSHFSNGIDMVLGTSFFKFNFRPINFISRIESFHTAMQYINFALAKQPYMGVGRNLAYTQKLFFDNKGFANHQHLISGDDDLFVNETVNKKNFTVAYSPDHQTISEAKKGVVAYWKQKRRHFSSSKKYKGKHKFLLFWPAVSLFFFWLAAILLLVEQSLLFETLIAIGAKLLIQWIVVGINLHRFGKINNVWAVPLWDPVLLLLYIFVGARGVFSKPQTWK